MTTEPDPTEPNATDDRPANVIAALAQVQADIGGIPKRTSAQRGKNEPGVNYAYRGIDEIAAAAQPLLGRYGIVIVPTVENHVVDELTINNKPWTDTTVTVLWDIYGPGGIHDHIQARTIGFGRDNSDKGMNKCMTGAYKNLLLRLLTIGDPQDDTDGTTHEADSTQPTPPHQPGPRARAAYDALPELSDDAKANLKTLAEEFGRRLTAPDLDTDPTWLEVVEAVIHQDQTDTQQPEPADEPEPADPADPADRTHDIAERHRQRLHDDLEHIRSDTHPATETDATPPETTHTHHNTTNEDPPTEPDQ